MYVSKRLKAIVAMIDDHTHIIDVGCDHGLLGVYAVMNRVDITCLAIDINESALKGAIKNVALNQLNKSIQIIKNDGLDKLEISSSDVVVMSGLGTRTIKQILNKADLTSLQTLIIQSNNDLYDLRKMMVKLGYQIKAEKAVFDKKKYYVIIKFIKGFSQYHFMDYYLGPILRVSDHDYIRDVIATQKYILESIPNKYLIRKIKLKILIYWLKKELK